MASSQDDTAPGFQGTLGDEERGEAMQERKVVNPASLRTLLPFAIPVQMESEGERERKEIEKEKASKVPS